MTDLSVFNEDSGSEDLSSFSSAPVVKSVDNKLSNQTVATQGAILSNTGEQLIDVFNSLSEAPEQERGAMMDNITVGVQQETARLSMDIAAQMTLDPDISMEERENIVSAMAGLSQDRPNSMDLVADQMGVLPSGDEDLVSEDIRLDAVEISKSVHKRLRDRQKLLNGELLSTNKGGMHALADLLEIIVPFSESFITDQTIRDMRGGSVSATAEAFTLLGNAKVGLKEHYLGLSSDDQVLFEQKLAIVVNESRGIVFTNDNDLAQKDLFMSIVDGNYYGDFDQGLDNVISVLDLVGLGSLLKPVKLLGAASKLSMRKMRSGSQPTSTAKIVGEVNPEEARKIQAIVESDSTDEAAKALTGTTREEAIVESELAQVQMPDGSVTNVPYNLSKHVEEFVEGGRIDLSVDELRSAQRKQVERLQAVNGITNRSNMALQPKLGDDGRTTYQNVYGPADSSYKDPQHGVDNVMFSMRDYGIEEADLTILQKVGDEYVPTSLSEIRGKQALREGFVKSKRKMPEELKKENFKDDYLIQVNFQHDFNPMDVKWDKLQVKRNYFDRIPFFNRAKKGSASVQRFLVDIHSMLDPRLTLGANVAVERSSAIETSLLKIAEPFTEGFRGLDKERQTALLDVINNNNFTGKVTPKAKLKADGYSKSEIELLDKWKESWDQLYHLENADLVKTLKGAGYQKFVDDANETNLIARAVSRGGSESAGRVYDSATNSLRRITTDELNTLYAEGGTLAKTRSTEKLGTSDFDYVIVRNKENNSLLRDLQDHDRVLNYREGYYTVRYKDPHIITRNHLDADGRVVRSEAVETAATKKDADLAVANFTRGNTDSSVQYGFRDNKDRSVGQMEDDAWSIHSSTGRTSQRLRGERLGTTDTNIQGSKLGSVEGPAESLLNSVRSVSRRTSMRDYIERYKLRFMDKREGYGDLLKIDPASGQKMFPSSADDFKSLEGSSNKRIADARTNLEYINYLENGYRNGIDDSWKALLNGMADIIGGKTKYGERFVRATVDEIQSPSSWFKARAFDAYLALNPVRQFVVQGHQASLLAANFTTYVVSQRLAKDTLAIHLAMITKGKLKDVTGLEKLIGMKAEDALALAEEYRKTGFDAAIDRNNLVENGLDHLVETDRFRSAKQLHKAVVGTARKVGFDAGERINIMSSWLAHRNKALEEGKDITTLRVRDEILAKSRNYTFNMNAAGDMPYNKNSLALLFQFMQVPHKAMLQLTNRALSREERTKLAVYNAVMLPLPVGIGYSIVSELHIENEEAVDFIANGLEGYIFNKAARLMFDDDTRIDHSSLAAVDPNAPVDLIHGLLTSDVGEILSNAPALSLWAGYNPRATNIITETYKFVTEPQDISPEQSLALMNTFASFSSGYMNLSKSYRELAVQEYDRRYNSSGTITDATLTTPEKFAKAFGFGTLSEAYGREAKQELYKKSKEARDDVKALYLMQKQLGAKMGLNVDHPEWDQHLLRAFWSATDFSQGQQEEYLKLMAKDIKAGTDGVLNLIIRNLNMVSADELRDIAIGAGVEDEITNTLDVIDSAENLGE